MMKARLLIAVGCLAVTVTADGAHGHGHGGQGHSSGYEAPSSGYGAPSSGYGAPSSGYGAPSSGYGAPSSGYGAPSSGYGAGPIYVHQTTTESGKDLLSLLPLIPLALIPLGLLALLFPVTTNIVPAGGRRKRSASGNLTLEARQADLLTSYLQMHGLQHNFDLQREMIARYLECNEGSVAGNSGMVSSCLERLMCTNYDNKTPLQGRDKEVATIILETIMQNEYLSQVYKKRLEKAGETGRNYPGSCDKYQCTQSVFYQTKTKSPK